MESGRNAAYDLSLFEPKERREETGKRTQLKVMPKKRVQVRITPAAAVEAIAVSLVILTLLICMMLSNVKITELNDNIAAAQTNLNKAKSENITLNMQLESRMSLKSVEDYAVNVLGMQKVQNYQISYINISGGDKVEIDKDGSGTVKNSVMRIISRLMEYFR